MMRDLKQLRAEMQLIRQHNQVVERQQERGSSSSFYAPPPEARGAIPISSPPADRDFPQAASSAAFPPP
eukprot:12888329-Prorocentrum_lima.AAC.1